jgi:hypothetical protein
MTTVEAERGVEKDPPAALVLCVVVAARILSRSRPQRIAAVLAKLRKENAAATYAQASRARGVVVARSRTCASPRGCLPRSIASALLCRICYRSWPTWHAGVRVMSPFGAHAWISADGRYVDEGVPDGYLASLIEV